MDTMNNGRRWARMIGRLKWRSVGERSLGFDWWRFIGSDRNDVGIIVAVDGIWDRTVDFRDPRERLFCLLIG